ncbi:MAG TPA: TrkA C-terminal domain-containing protein [Gemmataceae bacterium]|nr:TrkA C-terminal domain-containing protein [Gemmataceae bacterium]
MIAVISLLVVLAISMLITRIATAALALTGLSRESASFQARSALTGVGFTTGESESIARHPVRRRIIMTLMLVSNLGIATVAASLIMTFVNASQSDRWWLHLLVLAAGLGLLGLATSSNWADRHLSRLINWALRRYTRLEVRDYAALLQLSEGFGVLELHVQAGDWLAERTLSSLSLTEEGVLVLGVHRADGRYVGVPTGDTVIHASDTLVIYGPKERVIELDTRRHGITGGLAHLTAASEKLRLVKGQK